MGQESAKVVRVEVHQENIPSGFGGACFACHACCVCVCWRAAIPCQKPAPLATPA